MNTCRLCLNSEQNIQLELLSTYSTCIELILPEIDLNLTETPQICLVCLNRLEDAYNFKKKCLESEEQLKSIKTVKIKCEIEEKNDNCIESENNNANINRFNLESEQQNVHWIKQEVEEYFESSEPTRNYIQSGSEKEIENTMIKNDTDMEIGENEVISLENHQNLSHLQKNNYPNPYKCNQCEKSFPFKSHLQYHMINHSDEQQNICEICGKGFHLTNQLKSHIKNVHSNVKVIPYQCSDCGMKFDENERSVDVNMRKCFNCQGRIVVKLACNVCGKRYVSNSSLQRHKLVHSREKTTKKYQKK